MIVLGIETSCDETAAAVIDFREGDWTLLSEVVSSQVALHREYGGVVPELASREHLTNLPLVVDEALNSAGISFEDIEGVGATRGPGLKGCLLMGYCYAKGISLAHDVPFLGVNHIEGHILAPMLDNPELTFPYLCLVVSGGHTEIVEVYGVGSYKLVARTIDDAAGEAFDKSAHLLGFPYPGGAALSRLGDTCESSRFSLPKVMREQEGFSFSGLKTAISLLLKKQGEIDHETKAELAFTIQGSIVDALLFKLKGALNTSSLKTVALTGGVSANRRLRAEVEKLRVPVYFPRMDHCMDNGAMIAFAAAHRFARGESTPLDTEVFGRWPVEELA